MGKVGMWAGGKDDDSLLTPGLESRIHDGRCVRSGAAVRFDS
jgi:hypothetical protein